MLWTNVDIPAYVGQLRHGSSSTTRGALRREIVYRSRMKKFLEFISDINPFVQRFVFVGDVAEVEYYNMLQLFIDGSRLTQLKSVSLHWNKLPVISSASTAAVSVDSTICTDHTDENHRRRQRLFVRLFEKFALAAPNVTSLCLPFDWSPKSVDAIFHLQNVECLSLTRYSELQSLDSVTLNRVIERLPRLRTLLFEVWTPCATGGLSYYSIHSDTLESLDISQCRGFALGEVRLPQLKVLDVSRQPWSGPLAIRKDGHILAASPLCLHRVLSDGAPDLCWLNKHCLRTDWRDNIYEELDDVFKSVCPCELHCSCPLPIDECF
jgi:hypothetical protein